MSMVNTANARRNEMTEQQAAQIANAVKIEAKHGAITLDKAKNQMMFFARGRFQFVDFDEIDDEMTEIDWHGAVTAILYAEFIQKVF